MAKLLVIDTETGGFDPQVHSILSLGAVVWESGEIKDQIEIMIAETPIVADLEALGVNKIDFAQLKAGVPPTQAVVILDQFLAKNFGEPPREERIPLAGQNVYFDADFLARLYRLAGARYKATFSHRMLDTAAIMRFLILAGKLPLERAGLNEACAHFQIVFDCDKRHTALEDARITAILLDKLIELVQR
jgi:DNA polymerase III epsilon subunit-like protein